MKCLNWIIVLTIIISAILLILPTTAYSQNNDWIVYTPENSGLPSINVSAITIDPQGNAWIGTGLWDSDSSVYYPLPGEGLAKFDGENWTVYNKDNTYLPDARISALAIDQQGNIWIGTWNGLAMFDGENWIVYNMDNSGIPNRSVLSIAIDSEGTKWIGTFENGLVKFDGENWTVYNSHNSELTNNTIRSLAIDKHGNKWIGTYYGGLAVYREGGPIITGINENTPPKIDLSLEQNYPNPFNPTTTIEFTLPSAGFTNLLIYNVMGQKVRELVSDTMKAGVHAVIWDGRDDSGNPVSSGIYLINLKSGEHTSTGRMLMMK